MKALLFLLLPLTLTAQTDRRWTLQPDSTITVHYQDVRRWATNRVAQNLSTRTCDLITATLSSQNAGLRTIADAERTSKEAMRAAWEGCETERADLLVDRDRWKGKAKGRGRNTVLWVAAALVAGILVAQ